MLHVGISSLGQSHFKVILYLSFSLQAHLLLTNAIRFTTTYFLNFRRYLSLYDNAVIRFYWCFFFPSMPYLRNNPSLKDQPCCGDVTLIFRHTPSLADCDETILEKPDFLATSELKVSTS